MEKDLHFFLPKKGGWKNAELIRLLEPKEKHAHTLWMTDNLMGSKTQTMICSGQDCPICNLMNKKKNKWIRLFVFFMNIGQAFKRLFKRT